MIVYTCVLLTPNEASLKLGVYKLILGTEGVSCVYDVTVKCCLYNPSVSVECYTLCIFTTKPCVACYILFISKVLRYLY